MPSMERDYGNNYDDWLRDTGGDPNYGNPSPPQGEPFLPTDGPRAPQPPAPTTTTGGGSNRHPQAGPDGSTTPNMDPPGYRGGYWMNGQWVGGSPFGGGGGDVGGGEANPYDFQVDFDFPQYAPQSFSYGNFPGFKDFVAPTMEEILADPVLQAQLTEGQKRIKQDRAFQGVLNSGGTLKDLFDWQSDRIKLGGNDAFERKFKVYDINERQNPFNTWAANRDLAYGTFDRNAAQARDAYLFNQYEPAKMRFEDQFRRWKATGDWLNNPTPMPD